ncbi:MAG: hypothetical protein ABEJ56_00630 [Candidatus Nanohaloarchaea archaeon]
MTFKKEFKGDGKLRTPSKELIGPHEEIVELYAGFDPEYPATYADGQIARILSSEEVSSKVAEQLLESPLEDLVERTDVEEAGNLKRYLREGNYMEAKELARKLDKKLEDKYDQVETKLEISAEIIGDFTEN